MKALVAQQTMKEFDPTCEHHYPVLIVKAVDPGCTLELQIEDCTTGTVHRFTTTEDPEGDHERFLTELVKIFRQAWRNSERMLGR